MPVRRAVFLDKDGTLVTDVPYNVDPKRIQLEEGVLDGLKLLKSLGYELIIVSNQSGVARGYFPEEALEAVRKKLFELLQDGGQPLIRDFIYCPHHPEGVISAYRKSCLCRKPMPGMLYKAAITYQLSLKESWMIGDILHDVEAGNRAGCKSILIDNGNETEWKRGPFREPDYSADHFFGAVLQILQATPTPIAQYYKM